MARTQSYMASSLYAKCPITAKMDRINSPHLHIVMNVKGSFNLPGLVNVMNAEPPYVNENTELFRAHLYTFSMHVCLHSPPQGAGQDVCLAAAVVKG